MEENDNFCLIKEGKRKEEINEKKEEKELNQNNNIENSIGKIIKIYQSFI
jgi:hypothetical protein